MQAGTESPFVVITNKIDVDGGGLRCGGTNDFDPGTGELLLSSNGSGDAFLVRGVVTHDDDFPLEGAIVTLAVFLPLVFVRGMSGVMFKQLSLVVSFSLLCSPWRARPRPAALDPKQFHRPDLLAITSNSSSRQLLRFVSHCPAVEQEKVRGSSQLATVGSSSSTRRDTALRRARAHRRIGLRAESGRAHGARAPAAFGAQQCCAPSRSRRL